MAGIFTSFATTTVKQSMAARRPARSPRALRRVKPGRHQLLDLELHKVAAVKPAGVVHSALEKDTQIPVGAPWQLR